MLKHFYTIGMAGHIDHGKTTLTKALTNIETDRLQEEKDRAISIEPGYALYEQTEETETAIVDVPGHERFIRQMIAGVASIDAVLLVIAADEGVMPQTREHLHILDLLGITKGAVIFTKASLLEEELRGLLYEETKEALRGTFLADSPAVFVDSISGEGIEEVRTLIGDLLQHGSTRPAGTGFRMPIDQSFTVKGQGTVVRGTVVKGEARLEDPLYVQPGNTPVRVRQIQVHHSKQDRVRAGQRAAFNLGGISYEQIHRGNVLVDQPGPMSRTIDVSLQTTTLFQRPLKQRAPIKLHTGTAEVYGRIVFFDRNELKPGETVLCQLRLEEEVPCMRGDRFILRRPTPAETIGGGTIIDPAGGKYRFSPETVKMLTLKEQGSPEERLAQAIHNHNEITAAEAAEETGMEKASAERALQEGPFIEAGGYWLSADVWEQVKEQVIGRLSKAHEENPLKPGLERAALAGEISSRKPAAEQQLIKMEAEGHLRFSGPYAQLPSFQQHYPKAWKKRMEQAEQKITEGGMRPPAEADVYQETGLPASWQKPLHVYLVDAGSMLELNDKHLISRSAVEQAAQRLRDSCPDSFSLQDAKAVLDLPRKYLVPLLELFDSLNWTRFTEGTRTWKRPK
ncbi:selenocysteine-specific translation elongation factor [Alkalicoccus chagannorensis]